MSELAGRAVAIVGGAAAGAEVASQLAARGARVVVFEQNARPYGKIEDGLPRWHSAQRAKEYGNIDGKLAASNVDFVPKTRLGTDVSLEELEYHWGFHAVVLAHGAWRDRPLPIDGGARGQRGLIYQNDFIHWFNHHEEAGYAGVDIHPADGAIIIGGGLASIDVAKVFMLENVRRVLDERGLEPPDVVELEHRGIPKTLSDLGVSFESLELAGCRLFYRRRRRDMPLVDMPSDADEPRAEKVYAARERLLGKAQEKYLFDIVPLRSPRELIREGDAVVGVVFDCMEIVGERLQKTGATDEQRAPVVVSSIGSLPEPLDGIPLTGELYDYEIIDEDLVRLRGHPTVFAAGNAVTGRGNIVASRKHAKRVSEAMAEWLLGLGGEPPTGAGQSRALQEWASKLAATLAKRPPHDEVAADELTRRIEARWSVVGYPGDYSRWIESVRPRRA